MWPEAKWLDALKLPLRVMLGIALAAGAVLLLDATGAIGLDAFGLVVRPAVIIVCAVFSILSLVGIGDYLISPLKERRKQSQLASRRAIRRKEEEEQRSEAQARALARLDHLSDQELHYAADCLRTGSPTFYTWRYSSPAAMLIGKGLVWTSGDTHHQDHWPFSFLDFAWEELLSRKDEFISKDDENKRHGK